MLKDMTGDTENLRTRSQKTTEDAKSHWLWLKDYSSCSATTSELTSAFISASLVLNSLQYHCLWLKPIFFNCLISLFYNLYTCV